MFYYENFKLDDLKDYIIAAFRKIEGARDYFEILRQEAKNFAHVKKLIYSFQALRNNLKLSIQKLMKKQKNSEIE